MLGKTTFAHSLSVWEKLAAISVHFEKWLSMLIIGWLRNTNETSDQSWDVVLKPLHLWVRARLKSMFAKSAILIGCIAEIGCEARKSVMARGCLLFNPV